MLLLILEEDKGLLRSTAGNSSVLLRAEGELSGLVGKRVVEKAVDSLDAEDTVNSVIGSLLRDLQ